MSTSSAEGTSEEDLASKVPLTNLLRARSLLRSLRKRPRKSLGQHFLVDSNVLNKITAAAHLDSQDTIIEVGPGLGILTEELASHVSRVVAVELDDDLVAFLNERLAGLQNVSIVQADILKTDPGRLLAGEETGSQKEAGGPSPTSVPAFPFRYKLVADLPYNIASPVLRRFLEAQVKPQLIVVTVQREVAKRMSARPGDMSPLSVGIQLYGKPTVVASISPRSFYPPPKVHSAVVRIEVYDRPAVDVEPQPFFRVVRAGFSQPRKKLRNSLAAGLGLKPAEAELLLTAAGVEPQRRPQTLSLEEWAALTRAVEQGT